MNAWRFELLGYPVGLAQPLYLLLALGSLALGGLAVAFALRRRARVQALIAPRLAERLAPGVSRTAPLLNALFSSGALFFFALALAQPQCGSASELSKRRGIDVVVALDASKSMLARDVAPDRLERAKLELMTLLDELKGDRVGIVVFAGDAFIQCPLTSDYAAAKMFLRAVDPDQMQQGGTNLGAALLLSKQVLESAQRGAADRVVVLLSDGEDLGGEATDAAEALKDAGIRVLAVGIGSEQGEPIPLVSKRGEILGYKKDERGETVLTRLDRAGLTRIAEATDGEFFYQPRAVAMGEVVKRIDQLQKSELESRLTVRYDERYQAFAIPGFALLVAAMVTWMVRARWRRSAVAKGVLSALIVASLARPPPAQALGPFEKNHPKVEEGNEAYRAGRYEEALKAFDAAKQELPTSAEVEFNRGNALNKLGRYDEAVQAYQRVQEAPKGSLRQKDYYNLANTLAQMGKDKEAISAYRKSLLLDPKDNEARHNLEVLLRKLPPPPQSAPDGGTDGGSDGGSDGGRDGGGDGGSDGGRDGGGDGGSDGGRDGGGDGGPSQPGDGGEGDAGQGKGSPEPFDGGSGSPQKDPQDAGSGTGQPDGGDEEPEGGRDAGEALEGRLSKEEAEKRLDSLKQNEKNLQLWRFQQKKKRKPDEKDW